MAAWVGAVLRGFEGLSKETAAAMAFVGLMALCSRDAGGEVGPVVVVMLLCFRVLFVCFEPPWRLRLDSAGNKRRRNAPDEGVIGHLVNYAPLAGADYIRSLARLIGRSGFAGNSEPERCNGLGGRRPSGREKLKAESTGQNFSWGG